MRFALSALALSAAVVAVSGCSDEATPLEPAIPLLDAGAKVDAGSVQDASFSADAATGSDAGAADATTGSDAAPLDAAAADAAPRPDATADAAIVLDGGPVVFGDAAADAAGVDAAADAGIRDSGAAVDAGPAYAHTIAIDGVNDFTAAETFPTSTPGYTFYVAWDATYVYFGASGSDVQTLASTSKWWQLYIGTGPNGGTTGGVAYGTQQPTLALPAQWHLRWKTSNDYTGALSWSGSGWIDPTLSFTGNVFRGSGNDFVEMRIARATLGNPASIAVTSAFVNESSNAATYAGAPSATFTDGVDRDYAKAFRFILAESPASFAIVP
jgi:hypothetical protein